MDQLLAVPWVTLVRVIANELTVVDEKERLPDRSLAVVGNSLATSSNV